MNLYEYFVNGYSKCVNSTNMKIKRVLRLYECQDFVNEGGGPTPPYKKAYLFFLIAWAMRNIAIPPLYKKLDFAL